jgi:lactoylglutathione lyase
MKKLVSIAMISAAALALPATVASAQAPAAKPAAGNLPGSIFAPAMYVSNVQKSVKFYTEGLGMKVRMQYGTKEKPDVIVGFGDDPTATCVMLLSDRSATPQKIQHGFGYNRLAIMVPDLAAVAARLNTAGFPVTANAGSAHGLGKVMMITDPDGYRLELLEIPTSSRGATPKG